MSNFIVLVGLPYSGKSFLKNNLGLNDYVTVSSDNIILEWALAENKSYNEIFKDRVDEAQKESVRRMLSALKEKKDIIIDQTNLTKASRARKLSQVPKDYKKICIVVPEPTDEELESRKKERTSHKVPDSVLVDMRKLYQTPSIEEGFDTIYYAGFDDIIITNES